nr:reverse transcriptase domain-containing protein [Tanacetum cinerariifolium]
LGHACFNAALQEYCDKNYHKLLPIIAEKVHQEKEHRAEGGASRKGSDLNMSAAYPKALSQGVTTLSHQGKKVRKEKWCSKGWRRVSSTDSETRGRAYPRTRTIQGVRHITVVGHRKLLPEFSFKRNKVCFKNVITKEHAREGWKHCQKVCKEPDPFTLRIRYFDFPKTRMPSHIKTYDGSEDPEDHLKIFQAAAKTERWAMPTWCHMFNSTLTRNARVWFDDLPQESIDSYDDLKKAFLENYLQQKNASNIRSKSTTSSREIGNPWKNSYGGDEDGTEGPMIIKVEMGGHFVHRMKTMSKENLDSPVYRSQNVKILSDWQKGHITEEHDYFAIMHNGLRTRSTSARNRSSQKKDSGSNSPRISRTNYNNRLHSNIRRMEGVVQFAKDVYPLDKRKEGKYLRETSTKQDVIRDIEEMFKTLREINMKLNPKKCTFRMRECMFLGYKVNADGLKVCPDKVEAVLSFPSLKCFKDVQKLNRKLASLNRFLSKSAKKLLPFFTTLNKCTKKSDFLWTAEAETTFKQMKKLIAELPMLTELKEKEESVIYMVATKEAISAVLMTKRDRKQMPIYFVWRTLQEEHDIDYRPKTSVKGQILVDFIAEHPEDDSSDTPMKDKEELLDLGENKKAVALSKMASTSFTYISKHVLVEELKEKSIDEKEVLAVVEEEGHTWMTPIYEYLTEEILLEEKRKARAIRRKAGRYAVTNEVLYKRGQEINKGVQKLSGLPPRAKEPASELDPHHIPVAILQIGDQHSWTFPERSCMILVEISMPTLRTVEVDMIKNDEALEINLYLFGRKKEHTAIHEAKKQSQKGNIHNARVRNISFKPGDLVYQNNEATMHKMEASSDPSRKGHMRSQKH